MLKKGDVVRIETGGGGGCGHPFDRETAHVLEDVLAGLVSPEGGAPRLWRRRLAPHRGRGGKPSGSEPYARRSNRSTARNTSMSFDGRAATLTLAVDIGGTFTDVALADTATGQVWRAKTPSRPDDPSEAFLDGLRLALRAAGAEPADLRQVLHGTTVATNMILEGKGARAALVTTKGFRHVLGIGRQDIPRAANLYNWIKPQRPVPASRIVEVAERILPGGIVGEPLDEASVARAAEALREMDVDAVAICLLHAFANPDHERRVAEMLRLALPDVAVTASSDVLPVVREYERTLASVLNAIVMPGVTRYVGRIEEKLRSEGVPAPLLLMQSNGGVAGAARSAPPRPDRPVRDRRRASSRRDRRRPHAASTISVTVDIGGTSADICLIAAGKIGLTQRGQVGDWPLPCRWSTW